MTKKLFAFAAAAFLLAGCGAADESPVDDIDNREDLEAATIPDGTIKPEKNDGKVIGSCNAIELHSTCIEYVGSFWSTGIIDLGCSEEGMTPSNEACPTGSVGGCRIGGDTNNEMVTWFYDFGGEPIEGEDIQYSAMACNATLGASWVGAK